MLAVFGICSLSSVRDERVKLIGGEFSVSAFN